MQIETRSMTLSGVTTENRTITGIAVPYKSSSKLLNDRPRPYREEFRQGAFKDIDENVALYLQHDHKGLPLARVGAGTISFTESERGLLFSAQLPESRGDIAEAVARGDIAGVSIGFSSLSDDWNHRSGSMPSTRIVKSARLFELSLVANPAYPGATIDS
tara:strand:+ start:103 stop:582 length:480 start_codon:yes stop_codon:yes gene_type:complete